ncbi:MAG: hypothetical protein WBE27_02340 [Microgenomates group bacterium]
MTEKVDLENKGAKKSPETTEVSGSFGLVIKPDAETERKALSLAGEMAPNAEFQIKVPHITLYHGRVNNLPLPMVKDLLLRLRKHRGESLVLNSLKVYGGKFLFWNNEKTGSLRSMHQEALKLAEYLARDTVSRAAEEGLDMTPEELENVKKYGHPLVMERYTPHITLAYDSQGLTLPPSGNIEPWEMKIDDVLFSEMGKYGVVARVVDLQ